MQRDVYILSLFRHHYLNSYPKNTILNCRYLCWGYFDGIDITECEESRSPLFVKKTQSPISDMCFTQVNLSSGMSGVHGSQDIGIFRCTEHNKKDTFWKNNEKYPYFCAVFLQINDKQAYDTIQQKIEELEQPADPFENVSGEICVYSTYDNADLIALIQCNRLYFLEETIQKIHEMPEIDYLYVVPGVNKEYLKNQPIPEIWKGTNCFINDSVSKVTISLTTNGDPSVLKYLTNEMKKFNISLYDSAKYTTYMQGNEHLFLEMASLKVADFLQLLSFFTTGLYHTSLFGEVIYNVNILPSLRTHDWDFAEVKEYGSSSKEDIAKRFCYQKIEYYRSLMNQAYDDNDESLSFYYYSLIKTLNTLSQYENFKLSRSVFHLILPSLVLFDSLLHDALDELKEHDPTAQYMGNEQIKKSIWQFVDSVNSIIYHVIHTDQMFMTLPGQSGTTFSTPLKLCLVYSWFIKQIIDILNDDNGKFQYECLLMPVIESFPQTNLIGFNLQPGNRLIRVKLSQRSLYMPRGLLIILSHEIAHYVGNKIRYRKERLTHLLKTLSNLISEGIIPEQFNYGLDENILKYFRERNKKALTEQINNFFNEKTKDMEDIQYHTSFVQQKLMELCEILLSDKINFVKEIIYSIPEELSKDVDSGNPSLLKDIYRFQNYLNNRRKALHNSGTIIYIISNLIKIYQEVFSDVAAYVILDFDYNEFEEAFSISEGIKITNKTLPQKLRENIIFSLSKGSDTLLHKQISTHTPYSDILSSKGYSGNEIDLLCVQLYNYNITQQHLYAYAYTCYTNLQQNIDKNKLQEPRSIYQLFTGKDLSTKKEKGKEKDDSACKIIYDALLDKIIQYEKETDRLAESEINKLSLTQA